MDKGFSFLKVRIKYKFEMIRSIPKTNTTDFESLIICKRGSNQDSMFTYTTENLNGKPEKNKKHKSKDIARKVIQHI